MVSMESKLLYQLNILNEQNIKVNNQLSTGKAIQSGSEDSELYAYLLNIEGKLDTYNNIETQLNKSTAYNDTSDSTLSEVKNQMDAVNSVVLTALNAGVDQTTKEAMAQEVEGYKESMYNLLNEDLNGEYLYSGQDSSNPAFSMNSNGEIDYTGSMDNKTVLVDEGAYKSQGVTGLDVVYYTTDEAAPGGTVTFNEDELIVDSEGNTWEFVDYDGDGTIDKDRIYKNGDTSNGYLNASANGTTPETYTSTNSTTQNLEVKHNYFDDLDEIINALNQQDKDGNPISEEEANEILSASLDKQDQAYSNANATHAILGAKNKTIETHQDTISAKIANYEVLYEEFSSADLTQAAIDAQSLEITYSALYSTISRVNSLSLVNYM